MYRYRSRQMRQQVEFSPPQAMAATRAADSFGMHLKSSQHFRLSSICTNVHDCNEVSGTAAQAMAATQANRASNSACNSTQARGSARRRTIAAKTHVVTVTIAGRVVWPMSAHRSANKGDGELKRPTPTFLRNPDTNHYQPSTHGPINPRSSHST